ncbi:MAG: ATP-binding protein [Flavobacterium sp.]
MNKTRHIVILCLLLLLTAPGWTQLKSSKDSLLFYKENKDYLSYVELSQRYSNELKRKNQLNEYCDISLELSEVYGLLNDSEKSVNLLFDLLKTIDNNKLSYNKAQIYKKLGERYSTLKDTAKALDFYHKTLKQSKKTNQIRDQRDAYQNLFRIHTGINLDSAYFFMKSKYKIDLEEQSPEGLSSSFNNHFAYYILKGQNELAKKYLDSCYHISKTHKIEHNITLALGNYAYYHMVHDEDFKKAIEYLEYTLKNYKDKMSDQELSFLYQNLGYAYENIKNYERANHFHLEAFYLKDKIYNENISNALREVEMKYALEKAEQDFDEKTKKLEEKQNRNQRVIILLGALTVLSLLIFYFIYNYQKLKQNAQIKELDSLVQETILNATLDGQESERKRLSEVLHDSISALLSSASLHLSAFLTTHPEATSEEITKSRSLLKEAHDKVRDLSHELIPPVLVKLGLITALNDLCQKNSNSTIKIEFHNPDNLSKKYHPDFELKLFFIMSELINNILKHSHATEVKLSIHEAEENLMLKLEDNGIGFDTKKASISDGFGLSQIKSRIKSMSGKIDIHSKTGKGTQITIQVKAISR